MEACLLNGQRWQAVSDLFETFPEETQRALTFSPKAGEWAGRLWFWKEHLRSVLPPKQYHEAMLLLIRHSTRCVRQRLEGEV